jgi:hypothetical protein
MTAVLLRYRWLVLLAYPAFGLVLGLADPFLGWVAQQLGIKPGVATAVSVNLLLPLAAVALAVAHSRLWVAWLGAVTMTLGLVVGLAVQYYAGRPFAPADIPPVLVVAAFGYGVLGTVAAFVRTRCRPA